MKRLLDRMLRHLRGRTAPVAGVGLFYANSSQPGGFTLVDALILGVVVFVAFRLFSMGSRRRPPGQNGGSRPGPPSRTRPADRYQAAQSAWEALASKPADQTAPRAPHGGDFDADDFLKGAKAAMMRVHQALKDGDFTDAAQFTTPRMMDDLKAVSRPSAVSPDTEILLMDADILDTRTEGPKTFVKVRVSTLEGAHGARQSADRIERVVDFQRDLEAADPHWKIDDIRLQAEPPQGLAS